MEAVTSLSEFTTVASSEVGKLGISFHGMPPGRIEVKGVADGLFGSTSGVKEGDVLVEGIGIKKKIKKDQKENKKGSKRK